MFTTDFDLHFPRLHELMRQEIIWYDHRERSFVGVASDGVEVVLGHDPQGVESYLVEFPTRNDW